MGGAARRPAQEAPVTGWKRWLPLGLAIPFLGLLAFGLTRDARNIPSPLPGEAAPDFALETMDGDSVRLADYRGRAVILNFWASWCGPCRYEHPALVRAARTWPDSQVVVLGVLYQDSPANARRFLRELGDEWTTVLDPRSRTAIEYGVWGVPETFFIAPDGTVAHKQNGPVSWSIIQERVTPILPRGEAGE